MSSNNDQRLHFEYVLHGHTLFSEVNLQPQHSRPIVFDLKPEYDGHQSQSLSGAAAVVWSGLDQDQLIVIDSDEADYAPNPDGELTTGCRKCGVDYGSSTELKLHFGAVHSRQTFECCVCNKLFLRRHGFLVHIKKYHEDVTAKSFPCPFCEQIYTHDIALNDHINEQHKDPNPICPLCLAVVPEGGMKAHVDKEHNKKMTLSSSSSSSFPPPAKKHKCDDCPYESNRLERLRVHVQGVHQNKRAFQCELCEKGFKQKDKLTRHVNSVHLQQKPFSCAFCELSFARKDELLRHATIVHYGDKTRHDKPSAAKQMHHCPQCSYACERPDKLKAHVATVHCEERPFACHFCDDGKSFKLKDKLNLHINTVHLKRKPHECSYCHQAFGRKDAAKRHEEKWCGMRPKSQ